MKFLIRVVVDGQVFDSETQEEDESVMKAASEEIYNIAGNMERYTMVLKSGGIIVLPSEACKRAIFLFLPA